MKRGYHSFQYTADDLNNLINFSVEDESKFFKGYPYLYLYQLDFKLNPDIGGLVYYDYTEHKEQLIQYLKQYSDQLLSSSSNLKILYHLVVNYILLTNEDRLFSDSDLSWIELFLS